MSACGAPAPSTSPTLPEAIPVDAQACAQTAPAWFCQNLAQLGHVRVGVASVDAARATLTARWQVSGDRGTCEHRWTAGVREGRIETPAVDGDGLPPLWAVEPVTVTRAGAGTLIRATTATAHVTAAHLSAAQQDLGRADIDALTGDAPLALVVEQPSTAAVLARIIGRSADGIAATAWPWGNDGRTACTHVLIHPDFRPASTQVARYLLVHEGVHAVSGAPGWQGPRWVREGLAESVAVAQVGDVTGARPAALQRATTATTLPSDAALAPSSPTVGQAYADAAVVVERMRTRWGWPATLAALKARGDGAPSTITDAQILSAYRGR